MLHSPSYFYISYLNNKSYRHKWNDKTKNVIIFENSSPMSQAEYVNLYQHMFGNGNTIEGEYTLPRGQPEKIDQKIPIITQIREFMEETHCFHLDFIPIIKRIKLGMIHNNQYNLPMISEEWIALNGKTYQCDYSILIETENANNLIQFTHSRSRCLNWILGTLGCIFNLNDKKTNNRAIKNYMHRFPFSHRLDEEKIACYFPLEEALIHINSHRLKTLIPFNSETLIKTIIKKIKENR